MNENRREAYLKLIHALLDCSSGEEISDILNINQTMIDVGLVQTMKQVADFLVFESQSLFLGIILQATQDSKINSKVVYPLLQANLDQLDEKFAHVLRDWAETTLPNVDNSAKAESIAEVILNFSTLIQQFPLGNKATNLDIAITGYEIAAALFIRETYPEKWAMTQNNLGAAYQEYIMGERASNLEQAIYYYKQALQIRTQENFPQDWAMLQNNLGGAYCDRILGKRAENLEQAIHYHQQALQIYTHKSFPEQWAIVQNNLGNTYSNRIFENKANNIEQAIHHYQKALQIHTREDSPKDWAQIQNNLGNAYGERIFGDKAKNLEQSIYYYQQALQVRTQENFPQDWATTQSNLGTAYWVRILGDRADNLELAIHYYQEALQVRTRKDFPQDWATTQNNLGAAYWNRILGDRDKNLEQAIQCYHQALQILSRDAFPKDWAMLQNNLGRVYHDSLSGDRNKNLEQAIHCYQQALQIRTRETFPQDWATTQNDFGTVYWNRLLGDRAENLEQAIHCFQQALKIHTCDNFPEQWAAIQNNLGLVYCGRILGNRTENSQKAIDCYQQALQIRTRNNFPQQYAETKLNLGLRYRENNQLQLAHDTFEDTINTVEFLRGEIVSGEKSKQKLAEEWNELYKLMVEICLALDNTTEAIEYIERSKTRNLAELLATRDLYPSGQIPEDVRREVQQLRQEIDVEKRRLTADPTPDYTHINHLRQQYNVLNPFPKISFEKIQALLDEKTAVLEWYGDSSGFFQTFIITHHSPPIIWQSSLEDMETLNNWANEYLNAYYTDKSQWQNELSNRLSSLSKILHIDEIFSLVHQVCEQCSQLILIPYRFLHMFSLHALQLDNGECLLDKFDSVRYAPSCQLLQQIQQQQRPNFSDFFAIQDPEDNLSYAELEVATIISDFSSNQVLVKEQATKQALTANGDDDLYLSLAHCVHFACHGKFNFESPLESALKLANGEQLSLADIFGLTLNQCRLVTLSACETGLTDPTSISDEYIGLPSGFLYAGCTNVVSSLWTVNQVSTAFLMIKFYQNMMKNQSSVAKALNDAQRWLRDATLQQLLDWVNQLDLDKNKMAQIEEELDWYNPDVKPFNSPYHWAAFCAIGQ